jgi:amino acid transporter
MPDDDDESRLDRELMELLNELRVALPGIQVLFAFLFTVPFTQRFDDLTDLQRTTFFVAFLAAAAATVLLIAPSANHRIRWRERDKESLLRRANVMTIAGLAVLAVAMTAATFLVTDLLYEVPAASITAAGLAGAFAFAWYVLPLSRKLRDQQSG